MAETNRQIVGNPESPAFKASLRLWSGTEPLTAIIHASQLQWQHVYVKGQKIPAKGKAAARVASRYYACSEDIEYTNIKQIVPVLSQWLDKIESWVPPTAPLVKAGKVEAVLWIAIFSDEKVPTPVLPADLDARAKQAGVKILIENYTVMDDESGNPAKSFFGAKD